MTPPFQATRRLIAGMELLLLAPALLFMGALLVRGLGSLQAEPARTAQAIVMWYAGRQWTLWVLLVALPLAVLTAGSAALLSAGRAAGPGDRTLSRVIPDRSTLAIGAATLAAAAVLAIVGVHMALN